ncbi:MAG: LytR/AlgR family response regulator transcription factor [Methylococcaceae bacterium]|nr:response regulator [Prolixibacteraceae bacterium]
MKIVIIEDEEFAARRLERMIQEIDPSVEVLAKLESVVDSIEWFKNNQAPDLILLDIHLEDNLSFAIFDTLSINCPIVFTTATDELSTRAFITKGIDFLLKPIVKTELVRILDKYRNWPEERRRVMDATVFADIVRKPLK